MCGMICGAGVGMLDSFKNTGSLRNIIPAMNRKLAIFSTSGYFIFSVISIWKILAANLVLEFI
jgi:hypothetical protein